MKYCVIGFDDRSNWIRKLYKDEGKNLVSYKDADFIISAIPFSKDGKYVNGDKILVDEFIKEIKGKYLFTGAISKEIEEKLKDVKCIDLMKEDDIAILNSIPTAEGAIFEAMKNSEITICNSNCLVIGYGRIGKTLSKMLSGIGGNVFVCARNCKDISRIKSYGYSALGYDKLDLNIKNMDYIFNTVPDMVLDSKRLKYVNKEAIIIDLASAPGGVDLKCAKENNLDVIWSLSLPSKIAPKTAAIYIKDKVDNTILSMLEKK